MKRSVRGPEGPPPSGGRAVDGAGSSSEVTSPPPLGGRVGAVLEVDHLTTEFRLRRGVVRAVDDVSFQVAAGECLGLVGESGCGKSTVGLSIMQLLPGLGHIAAGSRIRLNGNELVGLGPKELRTVRGNQVAMVFQDPMSSLNPTMTIGRQIAESVRIHRGASRRAARERALEALDLVGMPRPSERLGDYPHQLSGGLRQRVMIALALACEPQLIVADEPTTALDVTIQAQILDLIDSLRERLGTAVILITHDMGVIAGHTDRMMVMYAGKIAEEAETAELFSAMRHPYASALLQSIPKLSQDSTRRLYNIPGRPPDLAHPPEGCRFRPRCPYASERCRTQPPLEADAERPNHRYACFHPVTVPQPVVTDVADRPSFGASPNAGAGRDAASGRDELAPVLGRRPPLLEVRDLVKEFPLGGGPVGGGRSGTVKAVSGVSFSVEEGETFGLVGESGCGKTTVGRLVVGLERPNSGTVSFAGVDIAKLSGHDLRRTRRHLQLMFQDPYTSLDPRMRVGSIIREPLAVQGIGTKREQVERVHGLLDELGLGAAASEKYPHEFSGGQRQRIGFARALALNPRLIVADEPVSALDVSIQAQLLNMMKGLQERHGLSYVMISHDLAVVKYLSDRIGVMYLGKLMEVGPAEAIYEKPAHPYTKGLIDSIPVADPAFASRHERGVQGELPSPVSPPSGCRFRSRCPSAEKVCANEEPEMRRFGEGHYAACHFPLQEPVALVPAPAARAEG